MAPRLLVEPGRNPEPLKRVLVDTAEAWARDSGMSGVHWLFVTDEDAEFLEGLG